MAQSPESAENGTDREYTRHWDALGALIAQGKSFSGRERNAAFLNLGTKDVLFATASGAVNLDQIDDSRAVIPADWDGDGDLDLWYANRTGPRLRFLRNDLAAGGHWVSLTLEGRTSNRDAVGARAELTLRSADGAERTLWRRVRAGDGFLSQTPKSLHFGFGPDETIARLVVHWPAPGPAGQVVTGLEPNHHWQLAEGGTAVKKDRPPLTLASGAATVPDSPDSVRAPLTSRLPVGSLEYHDLQGNRTVLQGAQPKPVLVLFWGSWCPLCTREMKDLAAQAAKLSSVRLLALAVDTAKPNPDAGAVAEVRQALARNPWPFDAGFASTSTVRTLAALEARALYPERALALPSAYLIAPDGRLAVIYHGAVGAGQLAADAAFAAVPPADPEASVFPFPGRSARPLFPLHPAGLVQAWREGGYHDDARAELRRLIDNEASDTARGPLLRLLADLEDGAGRPESAAAAWQDAIALAPADPALHLALGASLWKAKRLDEARDAFARAGALATVPAAFQNQLGKVWQAVGEHGLARDAFAASLTAAPDNAETTFNLAVADQFTGRTADAIAGYETALKLNPALLDSASNLAWLLATTKNQALRNPPRALALATKVNDASRGQSPTVLDTLAAAHAAAGDFAAATATATKALALARATGEAALATDIARHLAAYQKAQAWTE